MARGHIGAVYAVVASGTRVETWNLRQLEEFEASVESQNGVVTRVLSFASAEDVPARKLE